MNDTTLPDSLRGPRAALRERYASLSPEMRARLPAIALTLAIELLLVALLLSMGTVTREIVQMRDALVAFDIAGEKEPEQEEAPTTRPEPAAAAQQQQTVDRPVPAEIPVRETESATRETPPPILRNDFSLESAPRESRAAPAQPRQAYGPTFSPAPGDTPRIAGSGPNGEPLYAARWYREPYPDELAGYLSTAQGPGWGLIDCRTAPDFRVEDCIIVGESPQGSGIARAVQAAAWQFKVRPPQRGGRPMVGEWVRIRIDYQRRADSTAGPRFGS